MTKKLLAICSVLCLGFLILLTSCKKDYQLPDVKGSMEIVPFKTYINVKTTFTDSEDHDLYYDKVTITISLIEQEDGEEKVNSKKDVTITKPTIDKDAENPVIAREMSGTAVEFSSLQADTEYTIKLLISAKGVEDILETKKVKTISNGTSEDDPIIITNLEQLTGMNKERDAYYKLGNDIDCGGSELASIFSSSTPFTGQFDGDGKKLSNFTLYANAYTGVFGYMQEATVKNLVIDNVSYDQSRTDTHLGVLVGYASKSNISNIKINKVNINHSSTSSRTAWIGGLVGRAEYCTIEDCQITDLKIRIPRAQLKIYAGGFIGYNTNSSIKNCYVEGNLESTIYYNSYDNGCNYIGGFVGVNDSIQGITDCYAKINLNILEPTSVTSTGYKTHKVYIGGFMGGNISNMSMIKDCAIIGEIKVSAEFSYNVYVGGFAGVLNEQNASRLENCLFYPTGDGLVVTLTEKQKEENTDSTDSDDNDADKKEEKTQVAYVSLCVGKMSERAILVNTFTYKELYKLENQHNETTFVLGEISTDLSSFSETIKNVIANL